MERKLDFTKITFSDKVITTKEALKDVQPFEEIESFEDIESKE